MAQPMDKLGQEKIDETKAPFLDHLEELRWRLWRAVATLFVATCVCFAFHDLIFVFITKPLFYVLEQQNLESALKFRTVPGAFLFHFKTAILGGIFLSVPLILFQAWRFVAPGLYSSERKLALPFVLVSTLCFFGGAFFAYTFVLPEAFSFLIGYNISDGPFQLQPDITIEDYLGFTSKLLLAFGVVFELPVGIGFLAAAGLVTHLDLLKFWRWAVVIAFVLGSMLTPPDPVTQLMLAIPLMGLYGLSIGIAYVLSRGEAPADEP